MHDAMASSSLEYERITFVLRPRRGPRRSSSTPSPAAPPRQTTALMGPSGAEDDADPRARRHAAVAGASGLSGAVSVGGEPAGARRRCAVVGQEDALFPLFTVQETLTLCAALRARRDPDASRARCGASGSPRSRRRASATPRSRCSAASPAASGAGCPSAAS
ncbi:ATPase [Aureococcus anophagefferens]|nr:ATPase [Aureococcus anophagefferens]